MGWEHDITDGSAFDQRVMNSLNNVLSRLKVDICFWVEAWYYHNSKKVDYYRLSCGPDMVNRPWSISHVGYSEVYSSSEYDILRVKIIEMGECKHKFLRGEVVSQMPHLFVESLRHPGYTFDLLHLVAQEQIAHRGAHYDAYCIVPFISYNIEGYSQKENIRYKVEEPCIADKADILTFINLLNAEQDQERAREAKKQARILQQQQDREAKNAALAHLDIEDIWNMTK